MKLNNAVTVRVPLAVLQQLGHPHNIKGYLSSGLDLLAKPGHRADLPRLRAQVITKPFYETKVRLDPLQFYNLKTWNITPGSVVSWMVDLNREAVMRSMQRYCTIQLPGLY